MSNAGRAAAAVEKVDYQVTGGALSKLMAEGTRNQEIAAELGLSLGTVKVHVNRVLEKLDAVDRTEAVTRAIRRGLIALP